MTGPEWARAAALFDQALDLPAAERDAFLVDACGGDLALLERLRAMVIADARANHLLDATPTDLAAALPTDQPRFEGRRIGPYTIQRVLGRGGMGIVCLATRDDVGKEVALKLVAGGLASPDRIERFFRERRVLAQLDHPNIARLLDAGVGDDGSPWLAMEYIPGETIADWCRSHDATIDQRLTLFEQVVAAVAFAHRHLVVHRDLKPSNIMVGNDGRPRLLDFGIAKLLSDGDTADDGATRTGLGLMTPQYASPEQLLGEPVTTATDVYQLGALLFELLTGRPLHQGGNPPGTTPRPSSVVPPGSAAARRLVGDLDTIVQKATRAEAAQRYLSAAQLGEDIQRHRRGLPIEARPATVTYRLSKFVRRHRGGVALSAVAVAALLGFAVAMGAEAKRTQAERDRAERVAGLLTEMFAAADPTETLGDTVQVRDVLERGATRVRADDALDPLVKARLLSVIARSLDNLGQSPRALELQTEVVELLRGTLPASDGSRLQALRQMGRWLAEAGRGREALAMADEAVAAARLLPSSRRHEVALALNDAGYVRHRSGDWEAARPLYEEAVVIGRTLPDSLDTGLEATLANLGRLADNRGDRAEADTLLQEALARRRARLGPDHFLTARSMLAVARLRIDAGRLDDAEPLTRAAIEIQRRVFSEPHRDAILGMTTLSTLLSRRGRNAEAEVVQREVLAMTRAVAGESSGDMATALVDLASLLQRQGKFDEAADLYTDAIGRLGATVGTRHPATAVAMTNLAWTERLRSRFGAAERWYRGALPVLDSAWREGPRLASPLIDFGIVLSLQQRCGEAEPVFRRAGEIAARSGTGNSPDRLRSQRFLGQCLVSLARFPAAESVLVDTHRAMVESLGPDNQYTIAVGGDIAEMYRRWGKPVEAARYLKPKP